MALSHLVVDVQLVVDGDLEAGAVEDVQRLREQWQLITGRRGKKNAAPAGLSHSVMTSLFDKKMESFLIVAKVFRHSVLLDISFIKCKVAYCSQLLYLKGMICPLTLGIFSFKAATLYPGGIRSRDA
jgi:hypothetical protein